jgi:hypothetical protein
MEVGKWSVLCFNWTSFDARPQCAVCAVPKRKYAPATNRNVMARRVTVWAREGGSIKMELIRARECEADWTELAHDELQSHDFVNKANSVTNWTTWNSFSRSWSSRVTT